MAQKAGKIDKERKKINDKRKEQKRLERKKQNMRNYLGGIDKVKITYFGKDNRKTYVYKCPVCDASIPEKLSGHLINHHNYCQEDATLKMSEMRIIYQWCNLDQHDVQLPLPCEDCAQWYRRLDRHFRTHKDHQELIPEEIRNKIAEARSKHWCADKIAGKSSTALRKQEPPGNNANEYAYDLFVRRAIPNHIASAGYGVDYCPTNSSKISDKQRQEWQISSDDPFLIFYSNAEDLLDAFQENCQDVLGMIHENAEQRRKHVS